MAKLLRSAVALGVFDGVHRGHRAVLNLAFEQIKNNLTPMVLTFYPKIVLFKNNGIGRFIYDYIYKLNLLDNFNVNFIKNFNIVRKFSGEEFVEKYLHNMLNAKVVCCGADFRFGQDMSCGIDELRKFGKKFDFTVSVAKNVQVDGITVSSSEIRRCLLNGNIEKANELLGSRYTIRKKVIHGTKLGRTIGFPTINQLFSRGQLVPKYGVYASMVTFEGKSYPAMTNIGIKPTVHYNNIFPLAETHIIDFSNNLYGKTLNTEFVSFIRSEQRFASINELKKNICKDIQNMLLTK